MSAGASRHDKWSALPVLLVHPPEAEQIPAHPSSTPPNTSMARDIRAVECWANGISARGSAQYRVRSLVSSGTSETHYGQVLIWNCVGFDLCFPAASRYRLRNAVVLFPARQPLALPGPGAGSCTLELENVWIRRASASVEASIGKTGALLATRCTFENLSLREPTRAGFGDWRVHGTPSFSLDAKGADTDILSKMAVHSGESDQ